MNGTTPFTIGDGGDARVSMFKGNLKDLMIFKGRALSQDEVVTLMRLTEPGKYDITPIMSGVRSCE